MNLLKINKISKKFGVLQALNEVSISIEKTHLPSQNNPITILDFTGDTIGKTIGFSADLLSSYIFILISIFLYSENASITDLSAQESMMKLPLYLISINSLATIFSLIYLQKRSETKITTNILLESIYLAIILCGIGAYFIFNTLDISSINLQILYNTNNEKLSPFLSYLTGLVSAVLIAFLSEYITSTKFKPSLKIAKENYLGTGVTIINTLSLSLRSNSVV